jgi:hypothetical protein
MEITTAEQTLERQLLERLNSDNWFTCGQTTSSDEHKTLGEKLAQELRVITAAKKEIANSDWLTQLGNKLRDEMNGGQLNG